MYAQVIIFFVHAVLTPQGIISYHLVSSVHLRKDLGLTTRPGRSCAPPARTAARCASFPPGRTPFAPPAPREPRPPGAQQSRPSSLRSRARTLRPFSAPPPPWPRDCGYYCAVAAAACAVCAPKSAGSAASRPSARTSACNRART